MNKQVSVGIVGCGAIGTAMKQWIENHNPACKIYISDPAKGYNDDLSNSDIIFISIHIPTDDNYTQDLTPLEEIIKNLPDKPIFIRTTVLPGTCDDLSKKFNKHVYFMPEFLTQRTAYEDFSNQPMVFTGEFDLLEKIFIGKKNIKMANYEAELAKYAHNVFGALKVTYFNALYDLCQKNQANYDNVREGILLSGYINKTHTQVPGPDGKLGYGGKCFPKDVNAFCKFTEKQPINELIKVLPVLNNIFRPE